MNEELLRDELAGKGSPETYENNYLIEAGAGAGKTYIMVNRIINRLLSGAVQPDNIAAITFTEKATQEMLTRIDRELMDRLKSGKGDTGKVRGLMESIDRMQVSTIHGFCSRMLKMMPFESWLGPDFSVIQDDEAALLADRVFDAAMQEEPELFRPARDLEVRYEDIRCSFAALCEEDYPLAFQELTGDEETALKEKMLSSARVLAARVKAEGSRLNIKKWDVDAVAKNRTQIENVLALIEGDADILAEKIVESVIRPSGGAAVNAEALTRVLPGKLKDNGAYVGAVLDAIESVASGIVHARCMPVVSALAERYRQEKMRQGIASNNDLLRAARDMLRDSAEARRYFHSRFRTVYVDEMQDTDPVQAQILFFLTSDEEHFSAEDWRACLPVPGSLFLVGDPKQAIYRFRNADISVYMELERLFEAGAGRVEKLHFNFRSAQQITDFADAAFKGEMTASPYQAEYSPMTARKGATDRARIIGYQSKKDDAAQVAAFIAEAVAKGVVIRDKDGNERPAKYGDFMILTRRTKTTAEHVRALSEYGIPSNMAGARQFSDSEAVACACRLLETLTDPDDPIKLVRALSLCYGIPLERIREYRMKAGRITFDYLPVKKALGSGYEDIYSALAEINALSVCARSLPAQAAIEKVFFTAAGVWMRTAAEDRSADYASLTQLAGLVSKEKGCFSEVAARAVELSEKSASRELLLEEDADCVQIMNLHKAKGLEAVIIILAADTVFPEEARRHTGPDGKLHACLLKAGYYGSPAVLAEEKDWEKWKNEEEKYLHAEVTRLMYVAATRAMTCLVVNTGKGAWMSMEGAVSMCGMGNETDPAWTSAREALKTGVSSVPKKDVTERAEESVSPSDYSARLDSCAQAVREEAVFAITPSRLETDKAALRRDSEEEAVSVRRAPADMGSEPYGGEWGTVIHRVMELAVKNAAYDDDSLLAFAFRAVLETGTEEGWAALAARKAASVLYEGSPLRQLTDGAECYTELPFILRENDADSALARHVHAALSMQDARPIDLNGIIDLAVLRDGRWTIVDYKTDRIREDEAEIMYIARLRGNYKPQLQAYRAVLERLGCGSADRVFICAVNLGGRLIEL